MNSTVGVDEVGRGCWAGPVLAGAVLLGVDFVVPDDGTIVLRDSKKMTAIQRSAASEYIMHHVQALGIGWVSAGEVDNIGLTKAVALAMQRAVDAIEAPFTRIIIDGNINYLPDDPRAETLIRADDTELSVSCASIIAKVARDTHMAQKAVDFPEYGFERHVGYGTKLHMQMLAQHGVTELHRRSVKPVKALL